MIVSLIINIITLFSKQMSVIILVHISYDISLYNFNILTFFHHSKNIFIFNFVQLCSTLDIIFTLTFEINHITIILIINSY